MNQLSHEQRVDALSRLEADSERNAAASTLEAIDRLLLYGEVFSRTELNRIIGKRTQPIPIQRAIELYLMMARLMNICEPKGQITGPACALRLINFEQLTRSEALELRNAIGFRLSARSLSTNSHFFGLGLLTDEERELYEKIKPYFEGRKKPTLKILAARLLRDARDRSFSDRAIVRYIDALKDYNFTDQNNRRDYMISSVNSFGIHNKSAKESARYAMAEAVMQIGPVMTQMAASVIQSIQLIAQAGPLVPEIFPLIVQSLTQIPKSLPAVTLAMADFRRSVPSLPAIKVAIDDLQHSMRSASSVRLAIADLHRSQALALLFKPPQNVRQN